MPRTDADDNKVWWCCRNTYVGPLCQIMGASAWMNVAQFMIFGGSAVSERVKVCDERQVLW